MADYELHCISLGPLLNGKAVVTGGDSALYEDDGDTTGVYWSYSGTGSDYDELHVVLEPLPSGLALASEYYQARVVWRVATANPSNTIIGVENVTTHWYGQLMTNSHLPDLDGDYLDYTEWLRLESESPTAIITEAGLRSGNAGFYLAVDPGAGEVWITKVSIIVDVEAAAAGEGWGVIDVAGVESWS